jgi:mannose-6-phosphate isomerase-like protein (cupin superfamily)
MEPARCEAWDPGDGEMTERRLRRAMEHEGYEVAVYAYRLGAVFDWHAHLEDKCDAVVEGTLRIEIEGGETFDLRPGDRLYVPAGARHRAEVVGSLTVVSLDGTRH